MLLQDAKRHGTKYNLPLIGELDLTFTATELVSFAVGVAFAAVYTKTKHWALNNIFGITFCVQVCLLKVAVAGGSDSGFFVLSWVSLRGFPLFVVAFVLSWVVRVKFTATRDACGCALLVVAQDDRDGVVSVGGVMTGVLEEVVTVWSHVVEVDTWWLVVWVHR